MFGRGSPFKIKTGKAGKEHDMLRIVRGTRLVGIVAVILALSVFLFAGVACGKAATKPAETQAPAQAPIVEPKVVEPTPTAAPAVAAKPAAKEVVVKFTVSGAGSEPSSFEAAMMQMLEESLGIKPVFETMEWATFLDKYDSEELQMFSLGWVADYPDPQNFLEVLFHSKSAQNRFNYANPEVDALLDKARVEKDRVARMSFYQKAELLIVQDVPAIPTSFGVDYYLAKPWLSGFELSSGIVPFLKDVRVTDPRKGKIVPLPLGEPYGGGGSIPTLDPHKAGDVNSSQYLQEVYSGLVTFDPRTLEVIPDIAQSWEVSKDGLTYVFHLRKNATFHNGRGVTAHDFKWSFERAADPDTRSLTAETYLGDIVGVQEKLSGKAKEVAGVRVVDDYTLEVTIKEPIAYFLDKMTYTSAFVLDRETVGKMSLRDAFQVRANGTGPFRLAEYVPDQKLVLERSTNYYRDRQGNVQKFVFEAGGSSMTGYENDEVWVTSVSVVDWERVTDPRNPLSKEFHKVPKLSFGYVGFNVALPPFDDPKVRQAFALAIDHAFIVTAITMGMTPPATGILPPGMPGYDASPKTLGHDPDRALRLLRESRYYERLKKVK